MADNNQPTLGERLVRLETLMTTLATSINTLLLEVKETKKELREHVTWEVEQKYPELDTKFARKECEQDIKDNRDQMDSINHEISDLPDVLAKRFAAIWTEHFVKGIAVFIVGSVIMYVVMKIKV